MSLPYNNILSSRKSSKLITVPSYEICDIPQWDSLTYQNLVFITKLLGGTPERDVTGVSSLLEITNFSPFPIENYFPASIEGFHL